MKPTLEIPQAVDVDVQNLTKVFGKQTVLEQVNFHVNPGEIFVIMGPSGSGKSVLLKHIMGLEEPTQGEVLINKLNASKAKTHRDIKTAIIFQAGALFNSMSVYDNLAFYPREHRLYDKKTLDAKIQETLSMLSLEDAAQKMPAELSGGMKKRVAIARGLMMEPQLLLYDEPTSELDPIMGATIAEIIATLKEKFQVTTIVVSHDRELAHNIADRVAIIYKGRIRVIATPQELPQLEDPIVQEFLNPKIDIQNPRFRKH